MVKIMIVGAFLFSFPLFQEYSSLCLRTGYIAHLSVTKYVYAAPKLYLTAAAGSCTTTSPVLGNVLLHH